MKVEEFVKHFNEFRNEELRMNFVKGHVKEVYIPFNEKEKECRRIAYMSTHDMSGQGTQFEKVYFKENTNTRYILYVIQILKWYTDLELSETEEDYKEQVKSFEILEEQGLIEMIILFASEKNSVTVKMNGEEHIVTNEIERINRILDACVEDYEVNENNVINYLDDKITTLSTVFSTLSETFFEVLTTKLQMELSYEDIQKLKEAMNQPNNVVPFETK